MTPRRRCTSIPKPTRSRLMAKRCAASRWRCCRWPSATFCSEQSPIHDARMNYLLWQLADSGFPAGGFAHSGGLEAAMQHGRVADGIGLRVLARHALVQAGRSGLPLVRAVHRQPQLLAELDRLSDAFLSQPV